MFERISRKNFPSTKEMREGHAQWLADHGWSMDYRWHDQPHAACHASASALWKLEGYGYYLAADFAYRLYQSHRCPKCKTLVMHSQVCDNEGHGAGIIRREVFLP